MSYFNDIFIYIMLYSFIGWCCEVGYAFKNQKKFVNRGFLHGPICPIYGVCALTIISILQSFKTNIFILYIVATIVISVIEYFTGYFLEKTFKTKYWDYTEDPFNLHGRICLHFSLMWGALAVLAVKVVHPFIETILNSLSYNFTMLSFLILFGIFSIDLISTLSSLIDIKKLSTYFNINQFNTNIKSKSSELFSLLKLKK